MYAPDRIFHELEEAAEKMCDLEAQASQLEEFKKIVLASLTLDYLKMTKSRIDAETHALADEKYQVHITGMVDAKRQANRAKAHYHNLKALADARRTQESSVRAMTRP